MFIHRDMMLLPNSKSVCLKMERIQDEAELSFCFDDSCGTQIHLARIEACVFKKSITPIEVAYVVGEQDFANIINRFLAGQSICETEVKEDKQPYMNSNNCPSCSTGEIYDKDEHGNCRMCGW